MTAVDSSSGFAARPADFDVACLRCEYNVRDLPPERRCPECDFPIATSIEAHLDPLNSRMALRGALAGCLGMLLALTIAASVGSLSEMQGKSQPPMNALLGYFAAAALSCAAIWTLTRRPRRPAGVVWSYRQRWARGMAIASALITVSLVVLEPHLPRVVNFDRSLGSFVALLTIPPTFWFYRMLADSLRASGSPLLALVVKITAWAFVTIVLLGFICVFRLAQIRGTGAELLRYSAIPGVGYASATKILILDGYGLPIAPWRACIWTANLVGVAWLAVLLIACATALAGEIRRRRRQHSLGEHLDRVLRSST